MKEATAPKQTGSDYVSVGLTWLQWGIFFNVEWCPKCGSDSSRWTDPSPIIVCRDCGYVFVNGKDYEVRKS